MTKDLVMAEHSSNLALRYSEASGSPLTSAAAFWASALALNLAGKDEQADQKLDAALRLCDNFGSLQIKFGCLLTKARFAFERDEEAKGKKALERALLLGRQKAFFNTFFWLSDVMAFLCGKALEAGIQKSYVYEMISKRRLVAQGNHLHLQDWPWPIRIITLGRFDIYVNDTPLTFKKKAPKKPILLLKTLISLGGRKVSVDLILDALWPDLDGDAAYSAYTSCLHRLRKMLENEAAVRAQAGTVSLDHRICWVDLMSYEQMLDRGQRLWGGAADTEKKIEAVELTEKVMTQYQGAFLPGDSEPWIINKRERFSAMLLDCIRSLIQYYEDIRKWNRAALAYKYGISVEPLAEDLYRGLMGCYNQLDRQSEIILTYRICENNLSTRAGRKPSPETADLYHSLV